MQEEQQATVPKIVMPARVRNTVVFILVGTVGALSILGTFVPTAREYIVSTAKMLLNILPSLF